MIKFDLPKNQSSIIKVMGVGGGGSNAVTHMFNLGIKGVDFILCNTDAQAMEASPVPTKIQLGTKGLGAGAIPSVGRESALEKKDDIRQMLEKNTQMLFITAGMGGGTGTGAAPVIAEIARELDILTVGIVTIPFSFEGRKRKMQAEEGIEELKKHVDTLLIIVNDKLRLLDGDLKLSEAFSMADNILSTAAKGIAEIITVTGYINVDFEDVKTVMKNSGKAIMGSAVIEGEGRATKAVKEALESPLLNDSHIGGASNILLYITSGEDEISMDEVIEITDYIQKQAGEEAEIIWGNGKEESLGNRIGITVIATGFDSKADLEKQKNKKVYNLDETVAENKSKPEMKEKKTDKIELVRKKEETPKEKEESDITAKEKTETKRTVIFDLTSGNIKTEEKQRQKTSEPTTMYKKQEEKESGKTVPKTDTEETSETTEQSELEKKAQERIKRLKDLSIKLRSPGGLAELEAEPAFVRRKVKLTDTPSSAESHVAKYSLEEDKDEKDTKIKSNNKYIHDKPD